MNKTVLTLLAVLTACIATAQENTDYPGALQISALRDKALLQRIASSEKPSVGTPEYESLMQEIADKSLTAVRRDHNLPLEKFEKSAFLAFNANENTKYIADRLAEKGVEVFLFPEGTPDEVFYNIRYKLNDYNKIVVCYHAGGFPCADKTRRAKTKPDILQFKMYASLGVRHGNIGVYFGDPTDLDAFDRDLKDFDVLIVGYEDTQYNCKAAAKIILGEIKPEGVLPVETKHFKRVPRNNMENKYASRVALLQSAMAERGIDALIISNTDPHSSEYPAGRWCQVEWVSGFTGEAAEIVITANHSGLWTDTRYFIQAGIQLKGTGIALHKTRVPDQVLIPEYLATALKEIPSHPVRIAYDGLCQSVERIKELRDALSTAYGADGYRLVDLPDFLSEFWKDRPGIPATPVTWPDQKLFGETRAEKLEWLRKEVASRGCRYMLVTALDEIAWLLNVRGEDIDYNPYVISYLVVSDNGACWFVRDADNVPRVPEVSVTGYGALGAGLESMAGEGGSLFVDPSTLNGNVYDLLERTFTSGRIVFGTSPIIVRKAVRNRTEIANLRKAHLMDGLAMERFLHWVELNVKSREPITEWDASVKLTELRSEIEGYHGNSFENISAYGENAALPHYSTPVSDSAVIEKKGLYLVDSGGQYDFGTTDITRTIPVGRCSRKEKEDYTLVLKGMIDLAMAVFPKGTAGCQIDALAREPLWKNHRSFGHGTGHGIGHYLGVHEGPQSIRQNFNRQPLLPGMVTSDEPGLYREGKYGIRHENVVLCVEDGGNEFSSWLKFETLTLCHIDTKPVRTRLLTDEELSWLNSYNKRVYKTLSPYLDPETRLWLKKKCRKLTRGWFE